MMQDDFNKREKKLQGCRLTLIRKRKSQRGTESLYEERENIKIILIKVKMVIFGSAG